MTITRAFGFTLDTQTGAVERWAAGDPASVADRLDAARERMQSASVPTLAQIKATIGPVVGAEVIGVVKPAPCPECGAAGWHKLICSQRAHDRVTMPAAPDTGGCVTVCQRPCRCGPDGCADSVSCPRHNRTDGQALAQGWGLPAAVINHQRNTMTNQDQSLESAIVAAGANVAPRVTPADIAANIADEVYFSPVELVRPEELRAASPLRLLTFCVLVLRNGFTVTGESACASPENFNAEIGRRIARENAIAKVWPLMGYALKDRLSAQ